MAKGDGGRAPSTLGRGVRVGLLAMAASVAMTMAACSNSAERSSTTAAAIDGAGPSTFDAQASTGAAAPAEGASLALDEVEQATPPPERPVISTANLTVETTDVAATKPRVLAIVDAKGGYLFADETSYGESATATMTLKVPPKVFEETLSDLGALGTLRSQQVSSEDVTDQIIDLQSRITAAEGSLERTRQLLDGASDLNQIRTLEDEFARRQVDLEKLRGQQKTLQGRVDLATITLTLHGADDATPALAPGAEPAPPGFADGFGGGLEVATTMGTWALAVFGALVPFIPLLLAVGALLWLLRRRRGAADPTPAAAEG